MVRKSLFLGILVSVVAVVLLAAVAKDRLFRRLFFRTWLVEDANAISPEIEERFHFRFDDGSREMAGVCEYCEGGLFSETYLRFTIPDANAYEAFKADVTRGLLKERAPLPDRKLPPDATQVRRWWRPPDGLAYNAGLIYVAFDDPNQTVYGLACRD